eukprot:TRINITY_DN28581_c0_g1_i1.p2 TRINITY_DN28581_c0_g1~~TRINITY_DN28581_c0_g1_i1.p2  ORF type:complete len:116 (-),score=12.95 TRINITY_DN28581_c0_g1_i1:411-758(-)
MCIRDRYQRRVRDPRSIKMSVETGNADRSSSPDRAVQSPLASLLQSKRDGSSIAASPPVSSPSEPRSPITSPTGRYSIHQKRPWQKQRLLQSQSHRRQQASKTEVAFLKHVQSRR